MRPSLRLLISLFVILAGACGPGVAPGNAQRGYVVWGYVGQGTTTAAADQSVTLLNQAGQPVQTATSDSTGKFVLAYHQPGNYYLQVGQFKKTVVITNTDQRMDIDLSHPTGDMDYAAGAAKDMGPPSCSNAPPASPAIAPASDPAASAAGASPAAEQRDPGMVGSWGRQDTISSGDAFMATKLSLLLCADGSYVRSVGDSVAGGADWHGESGGSSDGTKGRWRTEGNVVYVNSGAGWTPYAQFYVEGSKLMFTFESGKREVWYRR